MKAIHKMGKVVPLRGTETFTENEIIDFICNFDEADLEFFASLCACTEWSLSTILQTVKDDDSTEVSRSTLQNYLEDCICDIKDDYVAQNITDFLGKDFHLTLLKEGFYVEDDDTNTTWRIG